MDSMSALLKNRVGVLLVMVCLGAGGAALLRAQVRSQSPDAGATQLTSWVVYWDQADGLRAFDSQAPALSEIVVFAYHFDRGCRLVPASPWVPEAARQFKALASIRPLRTLVTVVNDVVDEAGPPALKDPQCVHQVLTDDDGRAGHLNELAAIAQSADGIELDYENVWAKDREPFSALVEEVAGRLREQGKVLSVVVQPKTADHRRNGSGAMDWPMLSRHADRIKVMAYHYHHAEGDAGPLAPPGWVEQITQLAKAQIPSDKLCMVLTLHGFDWAAGQPGRPVDYAQAMRKAAPHGAQWQRDPASGALRSSYEANGVAHEVWLEDMESVAQKIHLLRQAGVKWIGLWHLGAGDEVVKRAVQAAGGGRVSEGNRTAQE